MTLNTLAPPLRWAAFGMIAGVALVAGWLERQSMLFSRIPIEGQYAVNVQYGPLFLARNGRLFDVAGEIPSRSNYTSGVAYGAVDFAHTLVHGAALELAGITTPAAAGTAYFAFPWQALVLLPLGVVAVYWRVALARDSKPDPLFAGLLFLFATTGHYAMVNWGLTGGLLVPYGWAVLVALYLSLLQHATLAYARVAATTMVAGMLLLAQPTYHTIGVTIVVIVCVTFIAQRFVNQEFVSRGILAIALASFVAFLVYNATPFLRAYAQLGLSFLGDLLRSHDQTTSQHLFRVGGADALVQLANYMALGLLGFLPLVVWWRHRQRADVIASYHLVWVIPLLPLALGFFAWNGMIGMQARILQLGTLLAALGAGVVATNGRWWRRVTACALVVAATCTLYSVPALGLGGLNLLTEQEWRALEWYADEPSCDAVLMTDFRIGAAATYHGCFNVIGPTAATLYRQGAGDLVTQLYYTDDAEALGQAIDAITTTTGRTADLILLSRVMVDVGVLLPDGRLNPIPEETWEAYQGLPGWTVAYETDDVTILRRSADSPTGRP